MQAYEDMVANPAAREHTVESVHTASSGPRVSAPDVHPEFPRGWPRGAAIRAGVGHDPVVPMKPLAAAGDIPDTGIPPAVAAGMTIGEQYEWHQAYLRRHRVSRRNFLRGSAAAAAVAALGVSPFGRRAYAEDAPLAVANRRVGYGADASSQLRFAAQLSRNPVRTKVFLDHGPTPALGASGRGRGPQSGHPDPGQQWRCAGGRAVLRPRSCGRSARQDAAFLPLAHRRRFHWRHPAGYDRDGERAKCVEPFPVHHDG